MDLENESGSHEPGGGPAPAAATRAPLSVAQPLPRPSHDLKLVAAGATFVCDGCKEPGEGVVRLWGRQLRSHLHLPCAVRPRQRGRGPAAPSVPGLSWELAARSKNRGGGHQIVQASLPNMDRLSPMPRGSFATLP
jgi:hypothetical protein